MGVTTLRDMQARFVACSCRSRTSRRTTLISPRPTPARAATRAWRRWTSWASWSMRCICLFGDGPAASLDLPDARISRKRRTAAARSGARRPATRCRAEEIRQRQSIIRKHGHRLPSTPWNRSRRGAGRGEGSRRCLWGRSGWRTAPWLTLLASGAVPHCSSPPPRRQMGDKPLPGHAACA